MNGNHPPTVAMWLLRHFGSSPNIEAIIGDLEERYGQGRSRVWYWRQALEAIVTGFCQEVWGHKWLATRALLLGCTIKTGWMWLASWAAAFAACNNHPSACRMLGDLYWLPWILMSMTVALCFMSVRLVAHISGPHYRAMVLLYVLVEVLAVPVVINTPAALFPTLWRSLWASTFTMFSYVGLANLGYPFDSVFAVLWGVILMALTMLLGGRIFNFPTAQWQRRVTGTL